MLSFELFHEEGEWRVPLPCDGLVSWILRNLIGHYFKLVGFENFFTKAKNFCLCKFFSMRVESSAQKEIKALENVLWYFVMECSETVLDSSGRWLYSRINTTFFTNCKVVSWQHSLVYQKVILTLIGCLPGLLSCRNCQNSMSGHNLESELYPSSTGIIHTQTQQHHWPWQMCFMLWHVSGYLGK